MMKKEMRMDDEGEGRTIAGRIPEAPGGGGTRQKQVGKVDGKQERNKGIAHADPERLFRIFNTPDGNLATIGLYNELKSMSSGQIGEMLVNVDALPNHARRRELRERLVDYLTMTDPIQALAIRDKGGGTEHTGEIVQAAWPQWHWRCPQRN